jgi:predicted transglutaminase-like cysteine proteinase
MLDIINPVVPPTLEKQQWGREEYGTCTRKAMGTCRSYILFTNIYMYIYVCVCVCYFGS